MSLKKKITKEYYIDILANDNALADESTQKKALQLIEKSDLPTSKDENWRKTNLKEMLSHQFSCGEKVDFDQDTLSMFNIAGLKANILVFVNGYYYSEFSKITEKAGTLVAGNIAKAKSENSEIFDKYFAKSEVAEQNIFANLNTAYAKDGAFVYVPANKVVENPIHIYNFTDGNNRKTVSQTRNLIVAEKNSHAKIIQSYHSLSINYTLSNIVTEMFLEENANLNYNIFQGEGDDAFQLNNTQVSQELNSNFSSNVTTLCGALVRNDYVVNINGTNCETDLNGLYMPDREQQVNNTLLMKHNKPHSYSNQLYRGIVDNKASAVFFGKVLVGVGAIKTFAEQNNNNVLLTPYARVHSKPQLEIYNDDVKCSHGSTTGQLDKEALFYMQTRGIGKKRATILLLNAFASEVLDKIKIEPLRNYLKYLIDKRMTGEKMDGQCYKMGECRVC